MKARHVAVAAALAAPAVVLAAVAVAAPARQGGSDATRIATTSNVVASTTTSSSIVAATTIPTSTQPAPSSSVVLPPTPVLSVRRIPSYASLPLAEPVLVRQLEAFMGRPGGGGSGSCLVASVDGKVVYDHNGLTPLAPASNLKVVTAAAALSELGPDFTYTTEVRAAGSPDAKGTVTGNVWLVGSGDPLLATAEYATPPGAPNEPWTRLEDLADRLVAAGVKRITGAVVGDEHRFDTKRTVASWPARYVSDREIGPMTALSVNDGFTLTPSGPVRPASPAQAAAATFAALLKARGVTIGRNPAAGTAPAAAAQSLASVQSAPLSAIVGEMLRQSDNGTAELLVKTLGAVKAGQGSTASGLAVIRSALAAMGLPVDELRQVDGSGLDPSNRLTCRLQVSLLDRVGPRSALAAGLAVGGVSGTLAKRFVGSALTGHVRAKTGSINGVSTLAGFVDAAEGHVATFAYFVNAPGADDTRAGWDTLAQALASFPQRPSIDLIGPELVSATASAS